MTNQTKIQYTPGPWGKQYIESSKFNEYWSISSCRGDIAIQFNVGIGEKENQANARLIAAAPELLKALEKMVSILENARMKEFHMDVLEESKQAITKAEGKE